MREAVVVSYARTGLAKAGRGGFNITPTVTMAAHAVKHAVAKAGIEKEAVEDCFMGNVAHGAQNLGRNAALLAGLPITTAGVTINRFCSSGLQSIAMASRYIVDDGADVVVAGGVESISFPGGGGARENNDPELLKIAPAIHMAMIDTADIVAERYKICSRISGRVFAGIPAPDGRRAAGRQVQGRNRPHEDQDESGQQGDEGGERRRLRGRPRRMQSSGHHRRGPRQARAGERPRQVHHRGQRLAALRRRRRRGADGGQGSRTPRPEAAGPFHGLGRRRLPA